MQLYIAWSFGAFFRTSALSDTFGDFLCLRYYEILTIFLIPLSDAYVTITIQAFLFTKDEEAIKAAFKTAVEAFVVDKDSKDIELGCTLTT